MKKVDIIFPKGSKKYVRFHCNNKIEMYSALCYTKDIEKYLQKKPKIALDVGSGLGRASVFLFKSLGWKDTLFVLADGNSGEKQWGGMRTGTADFYNSLKATRSYCRANGMTNFKTFNLERFTWSKLPYKPDLVYSFRAIGFHWPFNSFLEDVYPVLNKKCRLIFELRGTNSVACKWTNEQIAKIDRSKYSITKLFLVPGRKVNNFIILEKK